MKFSISTVLVVLAATAGTVQADHRPTLDQLAHRLQASTRTLSGQLDRALPHARHLRRDAAGLAELADDVHAKIVRGRNALAIRRQLQQMDDLQDHVEDILEDLVRNARRRPARNGYVWNGTIDLHHGHRGANVQLLDRLEKLAHALKHEIDAVDRAIRAGAGLRPSPTPQPPIITPVHGHDHGHDHGHRHGLPGLYGPTPGHVHLAPAGVHVHGNGVRLDVHKHGSRTHVAFAFRIK